MYKAARKEIVHAYDVAPKDIAGVINFGYANPWCVFLAFKPRIRTFFVAPWGS